MSYAQLETTMATSKKMAMFEKSPADKETKGVKEGSKKDMATDKKQFGAFKMPAKKATSMGKKG
jgi:hypothetical protein